MSDLECPYCGADNEHDSEQSSPGKAHHTQCSACEKDFIFHVDWEPCFYSRQADCLNGGEHDWKDLLNEHNRQYYSLRRVCKQCEELEYELIKNTEPPLIKEGEG